MHRTIEPTILYLGSPAALISTTNPNGSANLAPRSPASPSANLPGDVDRLGLTTANNPMPAKKQQWGYRNGRPFGNDVSACAFEVHIVMLHVDEDLLIGSGPKPHINPEHPPRLTGSQFMTMMTGGRAA